MQWSPKTNTNAKTKQVKHQIENTNCVFGCFDVIRYNCVARLYNRGILLWIHVCIIVCLSVYMWASSWEKQMQSGKAWQSLTEQPFRYLFWQLSPPPLCLFLFTLLVINTPTLPILTHIPKKQPTNTSIFHFHHFVPRSINPNINMQMNHFCSWLFAFWVILGPAVAKCVPC